MSEVARLWVSVGLKSQELERGLNSVQGQLRSVGDGMVRTGMGMTKAVTAPLLGIATAAIHTVAGFDDAMSKVKAISGATGDEFDALRDKALELGSQTAFSASQAAEAMSYLALAGWETNEILEATPHMLDLATAAAMDLAQAADIVSDTMSAFGMEAAEAGRAADVFAAASAKSNTSVEQLGEAMKYAAPVANAFGAELEEVAAIAGIMADNGIKGSQAGTALRMGFLQLAAPTGETAAALGRLNVEVVDADGNMRNIIDIIEDMSHGLEDMTEAQKMATISQVFGTNAAAAWMTVFEGGPEVLRDLTSELYNAEGAAKEMATTMGDNLAGAFRELKSQTEGVLIQIGDQLAPIMRDTIIPLVQDFLTYISDLITEFSELDKETQEQILKWIAFAAAAGPVLIVLGSIARAASSLIGVFGKLAGVIGKVTAAKGAGSIAGLGTSMKIAGTKIAAFAGAAGPIAILVGALGGIIYWVQKVESAWEEAGKTWEDVANERWIRAAEIARQGAQDVYDIEEEFFRNQQILAAESGEELVNVMEEQRALMNQEHDKWLADRLEDLRVAYEDEGTLSEEMYLKLRQIAIEHYVDMGKLTNEELYKIYKDYEEIFSEMGVVVSRETGDILEGYSEFAIGMKGINLELIDDARRTGTAIGEGLAHNMGVELEQRLAELKRKVQAWLREIADLDYLPHSSTAPPGVAPPPTWGGLFDSGGIVPGPIGAPKLAVVHGGETILPTHKPGAVSSLGDINFDSGETNKLLRELIRTVKDSGGNINITVPEGGGSFSKSASQRGLGGAFR